MSKVLQVIPSPPGLMAEMLVMEKPRLVPVIALALVEEGKARNLYPYISGAGGAILLTDQPDFVTTRFENEEPYGKEVR